LLEGTQAKKVRLSSSSHVLGWCDIIVSLRSQGEVLVWALFGCKK
jgi:hypothetical protein